MTFAIFLSISPAKKDYTSLFEKIKSLGTWLHYFADAWLLAPNSLTVAKDIYDQLIPFIDGERDYILVIQLTSRNYYGWLPHKAWEWIDERSL